MEDVVPISALDCTRTAIERTYDRASRDKIECSCARAQVTSDQEGPRLSAKATIECTPH
jgi:hypothetical protein